MPCSMLWYFCMGARYRPPSSLSIRHILRCDGVFNGGQDSANSASAQAVSEPGEFALDTSVAPGRISVGQTQHQVTNLVADRRATGPVWVGPLFRDQSAVPDQQCGRSDDAMSTQGVGSRRVRADRIARSGEQGRGRLT